MTPAFSARRRADEFEALVSRSLEGPLDEREAQRYGDLVTLVGELRAVPGPTPRPDFVLGLRERLMAEAETALVPTPMRPLAGTPQDRLALPARPRDRRFAAALGSVALLGATATVAVAAQSALPGESLYPVKRGIEAVEHRLAPDDAALGRSLLVSAEHRLTELEALTAARRPGSEALIPGTLEAFGEQSEDGARSMLDAYGETGDSSVVAELRDFTAASMARLDAMRSSLPASAGDELLAAGRRLADLDAAAEVACPVCSGGITSTPDFLVTSAGSRNLLVSLDQDRVQLDPAPVSGQDVEGIRVPEALQVPTDQVTGAPAVGEEQTGAGTRDGATGTGTGSGQGGVKGTGGNGVKDPGGTVEETVVGATGTAEEVVGEVLGQATGGAVGGLTGEVDDATGSLIDDVTGVTGTQPPTPGVALP